METKIKVGETVYFHLEGLKTFQHWKEGKVLEIRKTNTFSKSDKSLVIRLLGEKMYRVTCESFLFPKAGIWMHRREIRDINEMLDALKEPSEMEW